MKVVKQKVRKFKQTKKAFKQDGKITPEERAQLKVLRKDAKQEWKGFWTRNGPEMDKEMKDTEMDIGGNAQHIGDRVDESLKKMDNKTW